MTVSRPALLTTDTSVSYLSDAVIPFFSILALLSFTLSSSFLFFGFLDVFRFFMFLVLSVGNPLSEVIGSKAQGPSSSFVKFRLRA